MEFPAEVSTNCFALDGSSDIAYVTCTLGHNGDPGVSSLERTELESSPRSSIERLRSAETELRKSRILVSLDISRRELFTFYRKEDLQKDAKSIFARVLAILRKNACQMSSKNATKTVDLLRSDRARLHRQFMWAILGTIKSVLEQEANLVTLGLSTFLFRNPSPSKANAEFELELDTPWRLFDLKAQLLPSGQAIGFCRHDPSQVFERVSSVCNNEQIDFFLSKPTKVLLALICQYARYSGGYIGKLPLPLDTTTPGADSADRSEEAMLEIFRQQTWKSSMQQWLWKDEPGIDLKTDEEIWIEVELPLCEVDHELPISPEGFTQPGEVIWKSIYWPTSLCFVSSIDGFGRRGAELSSHDLEDPLKFVEDWVAFAADREASMAEIKQDMEARVKPDQMEDPITSQNGNIVLDSSQYSRRVTSSDRQAMTIVYPTPPDGALSQVTPGVLSVDGQIATPGERAVPDEADRAPGNIEVFDATGNQATIGTGFYDEDLFEDVPGQHFGKAEMADEPNWDFFDEPDANTVQDTGHVELNESEHAGNATGQDTCSSENPTRSLEAFESMYSGNSDGIGSCADKTQDHIPKTHAEDAPTVLHEAANGPEEAETRQRRQTSAPLSPVEVRKKLFPSVAVPDHHHVQRNNVLRRQRRSLLETISRTNDHQPDLKIADSRYNANGLFWFETKNETTMETELTEHHPNVPRIGIPKKQRSFDSPVSAPSAGSTDFDSSDLFSESHQVGALDQLHEDGAESAAAQPEPKDDRLDLEIEKRTREEILHLLQLLRPETSDQPLSRLHQTSQRCADPSLPISRDFLLQVAQVMVDQVSQSLFYHDILGVPCIRSQAAELDITGRLQSIYGDATEPDLTQLLEMSADAADMAEDNRVVNIPSPSLQLGRGDAAVDALPTIQPFWETLGLHPLHGKKSVKAICIHPAGAHTKEGSTSFLQRLSEIYLNCNLGTHTAINIEGVTQSGLVEWEMGTKAQMNKLCDICEKLGLSLATLPLSAENIMVYIVNPFRDRSALADICVAFVALYTNFSRACGNVQRHELNLQVVPMAFVASPDTVVFPSQSEYLNLGLETYNRCPPINSSEAAPAESGAAVMLAKAVTNEITFSLTSDSVSPLSRDGEMLHLGYSESADFRWIIACWSDNLGNIALTMTYCLSQKGSSVSRPRSEVIKELWEISADIMAKARGKWRLSVAHDGPIEPEQINEWSFVANKGASGGSASQCILILLTFDENPSMQFSLPPSQGKPQPPPTAVAAQGKYGTPVSTPSAAAATSSPELLTASTPIPPTPGASGLLTAPTPPDQSSQPQTHGFDATTDPDSTLVDSTDECWSLVLPFGLNNSNSSLDSRPALQSGFLLKRRGQMHSEGLVALGVNLIHTSSNPTGTEQRILLREILGQWRGLYTLARTKGLGGPDTVLPWHVWTAVKGCKAVSEVL